MYEPGMDKSTFNQYDILFNDHPPLWDTGSQGIQDHPKNTNMISTNSAKSINIKHNFTLLSANMRSLNANHENLYSIIDSIKNPNVLILSEIWNPNESCLTLDGYHPLIKSTRLFRSGGGVGIYISRTFEIFDNFNLPVPLAIKVDACLAVLIPVQVPSLNISKYCASAIGKRSAGLSM